MKNCLLRLINLHTVLTTSCLLSSSPFALSGHEATTTLSLHANIACIKTLLSVDICIVKPTLNRIKLAANSSSFEMLFVLFYSLYRPILTVHIWYCVYMLCVLSFIFIFTSTITLIRFVLPTAFSLFMCYRLRLSTHIKSILTYLLTYCEVEECGLHGT